MPLGFLLFSGVVKSAETVFELLFVAAATLCAATIAEHYLSASAASAVITERDGSEPVEEEPEPKPVEVYPRVEVERELVAK